MSIDCEYWKECGVKGGGCCIVWHTNPHHPICTVPEPTYEICNKCEMREPVGSTSNDIDPTGFGGNLAIQDGIEKRVKKSRGLGDTVKKIIDKLTKGKVKPCGGCQKRRERLNKMMPYNKIVHKGDKDAR